LLMSKMGSVWKVQLFAYNVILVNPGFKPGIRQLQYFLSHHEKCDGVSRGGCERTLGEMLRVGPVVGGGGSMACTDRPDSGW
jgi:hypothetical protein